jgi:creatinine amidohydrolase
LKIADMTWRQVETYLAGDDRAVVPLGSTEQHADLSLSVDSILAERVAIEAAAPLGVPVFPVVAYGITPYFSAFPGTVTLSADTYTRMIRDILTSLAKTGFRRILLVNGHGGNQPAATTAVEFLTDHPECRVRFHNWWVAPKTYAKVKETDPVASHASWMENFPWTRLPNIALPGHQKPAVDLEAMRTLPPGAVRDLIGDGNLGGVYQRPDAEMQAIWDIAVAETRALLHDGWA